MTTTPATTKPTQKEPSKGSPPRLLLSLDSCASEDEHPPQSQSLLYSGVIIIAGLTCVELFCRFVLNQMKDMHPVLENEVHRQILARHIGVDTFSLALLGIMGYQARHIVAEVAELWWNGKRGAVVPAGYLNRLYMVHPQAFRICVFFFWYQVKNSYDTLIWNDGIEFVIHHIFSLVAAWVGIGPFFGHFYAVFYFALCEVSTCVLCVLANFDDKNGVPGLGEAFPTAKVVVGAMFIVLFIICRCITWPIFAYHFFQDTMLALKEKDPRTTPTRQMYLKFLCVSLTALSILQIAWLGQIFVIAGEELQKAGFM